MIDWRPIIDLPEEWRDGRFILLWNGDPNIGQWYTGARWYDPGPGWIDDGEGGPIDDVTHFAAINRPNDESA